MDFPLDIRRFLYINVLMGQWESVGRVLKKSPSVCSKPVAEVFGPSAFFVSKEFRSGMVHKEMTAELDRSSGQWPGRDGHF